MVSQQAHKKVLRTGESTMGKVHILHVSTPGLNLAPHVTVRPSGVITEHRDRSNPEHYQEWAKNKPKERKESVQYQNDNKL